MKLGCNTIAREERDYYLLYNGDNGCLISLRKDIYDELIIQDKKGHDNYSDLYNFLFHNDFLEEKSEKKPLCNTKSTGNVKPSIMSKLISLRSAFNPFSVIWALTPLCNLRCIYCFPDAASHRVVHKTISTKGLLKIADQLIASKVFRITLSGGECLLINDIWKIVKRLRDAGTTVFMISNGTTITDSVIENLKKYGISIGISLDAPNEKINSITRGSNVFKKAVGAIKRLKENGIQQSVIVTITRYNFPFLSEHLEFLEKLGINFVILQDLRPFGSKESYDKTRLTIQQEDALLKDFNNIINRHNHLVINPGELFTFFRSNVSGKIMQCPAGDNSAYIDFYGDMYPCPALSTFKMGNLLEDVSITELWQNSDAIQKLREIKDMPIDRIPGCRSCSNKSHCEGGCRGDALFYNNDLFGLPSRCPKALGVGNFSTKQKTHSKSHMSLCTKDL